MNVQSAGTRTRRGFAWKATIAVGLAALTGCTVGPNYHRPAIDVPQTWRFEEKDTKDFVDTAWWEQFDDPVLNDLVRAALENNHDIQVAAARIQDFMGRQETENAGLFPQISGTAGGARPMGPEVSSSYQSSPAKSGLQKLDAVGNDATQIRRGLMGLPASAAITGNAPAPKYPKVSIRNKTGTFEGLLNASWQLDLWGKLRREDEAARANVLGAQESKRAVILTLVTAVANAYVDLRSLDKQLEIAKATTKSREDAYKLFQLRFEGGVISLLELNQAKSNYEQVRATIPVIEKSIAFTENSLCVLLGRNPEAIARGKSLETLSLPAVPSGMPSSLLENRPDIREAEQALIAANALIGAAHAQYFPSISLTGSLGYESPMLANLFLGKSRNWSYSVPLAGPIFDAGAIAGEVKSAEAVQQEALARYQRAIQSAFRDVEDALIDQRKTREQLEALEQQVEAQRKYAYYARRRFDNGYTSYIEVLDAERGLYAAELSLSDTKGQLFGSLVNLYSAMGGGWVAKAETQTEKGADTPPDAKKVSVQPKADVPPAAPH